MLLGSTLLEVGIGVIFVYLLLSLLCSAFSELIEAFAKHRARDLEIGIGKLLSDPGLAEAFFNHPLVKPLGEKPSYIPSRTFSLALWSLATTGAAKGEKTVAGVTRDLHTIKRVIADLDDAKYHNIKISLLTLIDEAGNDLGKARTNIEGWYDDAMERVSGWYKRRTHLRLIAMGFIAAALLNVDTINVVKALWYNDTLRNSVAVAADDYLKANPKPTPSPSAATAAASTPTMPAAESSPEAKPSPSPTVTPGEGTESEQVAKPETPLQKITAIRGELDNLGLPIGWLSEPQQPDKKKYESLSEPERTDLYKKDLEAYKQAVAAYKVDPRRLPQGPGGWLLKLLGMFLTALAVSQGAPFWFDLLNKIIVIRSTVKPREKSPEPASKDTVPKPVQETKADNDPPAAKEDEANNKS